jgi:hypothetical protein
MRYYVYALIDPTNNNLPFYIGKGLDNRLQSHFLEAAKIRTKPDSDGDILGCDTQSILADAKTAPTPDRLARIVELSKQHFDHTRIARIIARRLDERTAFAVEGFLIRNVYGVSKLTNRVEGSHAYRFRDYGNHDFIQDFDIEIDVSESRLDQIESRYGPYYVYTLRDPRTQNVFYVGKGTRRRLFAHFIDAQNKAVNLIENSKLRLLFSLLQSGFRTKDIARIEARVETEQQAFALEALLIKFVHGFDFIENVVAGHHGEMFRAKGDWTMRRGFDLPYVCNPGQAVDRADKRDGMIGEGLAIPLEAIKLSFPHLRFKPPAVLNAGELGITTDLIPASGGAGAQLKIFIRRKKIQVELRPITKPQKAWIQAHFKHLGAYPLRRRDEVFFPDAWRGPRNMTDDLEVISHRIRIIEKIVNAIDRISLSEEIRLLLPCPL